MNLAAMFDPQPGIAAHRAHAAGCRYTLPDYPVPGGVPIRADGHQRREPESWPQPPRRYAPRVPLSPALAECMSAAARLPAPFTVVDLAAELYGTIHSDAQKRAWALVQRLLLAELVRRVDEQMHTGTRPATLFEILPDEEAGQA